MCESYCKILQRSDNSSDQTLIDGVELFYLTAIGLFSLLTIFFAVVEASVDWIVFKLVSTNVAFRTTV